jgi:GTPase SAR1 family protein
MKKPNVFSTGFFNSSNNAAKDAKKKGSTGSNTKSNQSQKHKAASKVIVLGNQHVGKTSIINRYCHDKFRDHQAETQTQDFHDKPVHIHNLYN